MRNLQTEFNFERSPNKNILSVIDFNSDIEGKGFSIKENDLLKTKATDNLKKLSNKELDENLKSLVTKEKQTLKSILLHIAEVDKRKLYLEFAYPTLRAYLEERMGYDGGSAQRRIDAARLSHHVPDVIDCLESGELKFSQVTFFQKALRENKNQIITTETKENIIESIKNKTTMETQSLISKALDIKVKQGSKITHQADESVRLEISFRKSQWDKLNKMRELLFSVSSQRRMGRNV